AVQTDIDLATAFGARQTQKHDLVRTFTGVSLGFGQGPQHLLPGSERHQDPPTERTACGLDPVAGGAVQLIGFFVQPPEQALTQSSNRLCDTGQATSKALSYLGQAGAKWEDIALNHPPARLLPHGASKQLPADQMKKGLGGVRPANLQAADIWVCGGNAV